MNLLLFVLVGLIAGWVASATVRGHAFGTGGNIIVGIVGAFIGGILFDVFSMQEYGLWGAIAMAVVGAGVFLIIAGYFPKLPSTNHPTTHHRI
ncbi:MAG: GlsB/YeaQ/YmgE family stress response membrane protein [Oligoflexia bacterium]|nr:GlsB/YeaQ/YmgE family stress response membrane protein [Oligoflexia bacterium]